VVGGRSNAVTVKMDITATGAPQPVGESQGCRGDFVQVPVALQGTFALAEAVERAAETRDAQASPDLATLETEIAKGLETLEWRRRESNPRPSSHRSERLQA
jgi:hypothetical protein